MEKKKMKYEDKSMDKNDMFREKDYTLDLGLETIKGYSCLEQVLDGVAVRGSFAKPLFDSLESQFGDGINKYGSRAFLRGIDDDLNRGDFAIDDYVARVEEVQASEQPFTVVSDGPSICYGMRVGDNVLGIIYTRDDTMVKVLSLDSEAEVSFSLARDGNVSVRDSGGLSEREALDVFRLYSPFLLEQAGASTDVISCDSEFSGKKLPGRKMMMSLNERDIEYMAEPRFDSGKLDNPIPDISEFGQDLLDPIPYISEFEFVEPKIGVGETRNPVTGRKEKVNRYEL
jgi:hypothetical protein